MAVLRLEKNASDHSGQRAQKSVTFLCHFGQFDSAYVTHSVAVLDEISLRSPRKIFSFIITMYIYRIKVSKNNNLILKKTSLVTQYLLK